MSISILAVSRKIRGLRVTGGLTREALAERSGLPLDAIRRLERGGYTPSYTTLRCVCIGLGVRLSAFFEALEREEQAQREIDDMLATLSPSDLELIAELLRLLLDEIDRSAPEPATPAQLRLFEGEATELEATVRVLTTAGLGPRPPPRPRPPMAGQLELKFAA
jgi:transcriptional regulator with XRE-family HTH domain